MEDILDDPKLSEVSPEAFRAFIRLLAMLNRMRSEDGKISVDKRTICFITARNRVDYAEASLSQLVARSLLAMTKVGPRYDLAVRKWAKLNGSGFHSDTGTDTGTDTEEKKEGACGSDAPKGYETGEWLLPQMRKKLMAKSTEAELRLWLGMRWDEVVASSRIESADDGDFRGHAQQITFARWIAYLKERDPSKRQFFREASARQKIANREAFESKSEAEPDEQSALDLDNPLSGLLSGENPYARSH